MKRFRIVLAWVVGLSACDREHTTVSDAQRIGAFCDATMAHARDSHDSLSVMLACVQLVEINRIGRSAEDARNMSAIAIGLSASAKR